MSEEETLYDFFDFVVGSLLLGWSMNYWLVFADKGIEFPYPAAFLVCLCSYPKLAQVSVFVGIATFLVSYFL